MKLELVCMVALSLLITVATSSQVMAEEMPTVTQVTEQPQGETQGEIQEVSDSPSSIVEESGSGSQIPELAPVLNVGTYTEEDLEILAHAICGEAQTYPDEEQLYVGSVIINRKNHSTYPDTIKEVVFQRGQYACTWDGNYYRQPTSTNYRNARWLLENGSVLPENVIYQATFKQGSGVHLATKYHKYCYW